MIENAQTIEAVAYNLCQFILKVENKKCDRESILSAYSECLSVVKGNGVIKSNQKAKEKSNNLKLIEKSGTGTTKGWN